MKIRPSIRRITSVAIGVSAVLAGSTGLAHALPANYYQPESAAISTPHPCEASTHDQTGQCVFVETPAQHWMRETELAFACPSKYPYPFEGIFSGNPTWFDRSHLGWAVVKAVAANGLPDQKDWATFNKDGLSFAGTATTPGYVTIIAHPVNTEPNDSFIQGRYQCSDTPANPR